MRVIAISAALAALIGALAGYQWRDRGANADLAAAQLAHAEAMATLLRAAHQAEGEYRAKEAAWEAEKQEIVNAAKTDLAAARADADRVRVALERLRNAHAAAGRGAAAASASAPAGGEAAPAPSPLPADLLLRLGDAAGELARHADEARIAGLACERAYRSVETPRLGARQ